MTQERDGPASVSADRGQVRAAAERTIERSATSPPAQPRPRKWVRILKALVDGRTLNRFEATRDLRDWCLNTTISQLEQRGVRILRKDETVPGAFGPVHCCRYWLAPESIALARELLGDGHVGA